MAEPNKSIDVGPPGIEGDADEPIVQPSMSRVHSSYNPRTQSIIIIVVLLLIVASMVIFVAAVINHEPNDGPRNPYQSIGVAASPGDSRCEEHPLRFNLAIENELARQSRFWAKQYGIHSSEKNADLPWSSPWSDGILIPTVIGTVGEIVD